MPPFFAPQTWLKSEGCDGRDSREVHPRVSAGTGAVRCIMAEVVESWEELCPKKKGRKAKKHQDWEPSGTWVLIGFKFEP